MNPESPQTPREQLEARLTALLLGELSPAEAAEVRAALAQDADLARLHEQLSRTIGLVREAAVSPGDKPLTATEPLRMSPEKREKLLGQFKVIAPAELEGPRRERVRWYIPASIAAAVIGLLTLVSMMLPLAKSREMALARRIGGTPESDDKLHLWYAQPSVAATPRALDPSLRDEHGVVSLTVVPSDRSALVEQRKSPSSLELGKPLAQPQPPAVSAGALVSYNGRGASTRAAATEGAPPAQPKPPAKASGGDLYLPAQSEQTRTWDFAETDNFSKSQISEQVPQSGPLGGGAYAFGFGGMGGMQGGGGMGGIGVPNEPVKKLETAHFATAAPQDSAWGEKHARLAIRLPQNLDVSTGVATDPTGARSEDFFTLADRGPATQPQAQFGVADGSGPVAQRVIPLPSQATTGGDTVAVLSKREAKEELAPLPVELPAPVFKGAPATLPTGPNVEALSETLLAEQAGDSLAKAKAGRSAGQEQSNRRRNEPAAAAGVAGGQTAFGAFKAADFEAKQNSKFQARYFFDTAAPTALASPDGNAVVAGRPVQSAGSGRVALGDAPAIGMLFEKTAQPAGGIAVSGPASTAAPVVPPAAAPPRLRRRSTSLQRPTAPSLASRCNWWILPQHSSPTNWVSPRCRIRQELGMSRPRAPARRAALSMSGPMSRAGAEEPSRAGRKRWPGK